MPGSKISEMPFFWAGHGIGRPPSMLVAEHSQRAEDSTQSIIVDACSEGAPVSKLTPTPSPAQQLARSIVTVVGSDQAARHSGGHNVREVVDALALASAELLTAFAQSLPAGTDLVQVLVDRLQEQSRGAAGAGAITPRRPTH